MASSVRNLSATDRPRRKWGLEEKLREFLRPSAESSIRSSGSGQLQPGMVAKMDIHVRQMPMDLQVLVTSVDRSTELFSNLHSGTTAVSTSTGFDSVLQSISFSDS